jgi:hypothetical protein
MLTRTSTLTVDFTTSEEAGAVYGILRELKSLGFISDFYVGEDSAETNVSPESVDAVVAAIEDLKYKRGLRGISWYTK